MRSTYLHFFSLALTSIKQRSPLQPQKTTIAPHSYKPTIAPSTTQISDRAKHELNLVEQLYS
ncbi:hypothetical protein H6F42_17770 [Pseudanabaena sp. FACHB-1998]|nr:hypothetical protein [Pseudanabaena sp. FACHB-1998]